MPPPTTAAFAPPPPPPDDATTTTAFLPPAPTPRHLPDGIVIGGWRITTRRRPIAGDAQLTAIATALGIGGGAEAAAPAGSDATTTTPTQQKTLPVSLPEILFADSVLLLEHQETGAQLRFAAVDALKEWRREDLPPARVGAADAWQRARREEIARQGAVVLSYDWTFTTPYRGSTTGVGGGGGGGEEEQAERQEQQQQQEQQPDGATTTTTTTWRPTTTRTIDRHLLSSRADPILYYADVPLYESELDDNGAVSLSAKVRVMPRCWLVLLRLFVRVDGRLARLRETRVYCRFDSRGEPGVVVRETRHHEGDGVALRAAGVAAAVAGGAGGAFADGDSAAATFGAVAPACMKLFETEELVLAGHE
jgi:type 2A phosphatase activator TIP41